MTTLEYTEEFSTDSSLVDDVYYNDHDQTLSVDLNDEIYRYSRVPKRVFEDFRAAASKGRFYGREVKRQYGPGEYIGNYDDVEFERVKTGVPAPSMGAVGTPKGLTYAEGAKVFSLDASEGSHLHLTPRTFALAPEPATAVVERLHKVVFTSDGNTRREYSVKAEDVTGAVQALSEVADALGVTLSVKEVTTYFE